MSSKHSSSIHHRLKMFGSLLPKAPIPIFGGQSASTITVNPSNDFEVNAPPDDTVSAMRFSPATLPQTFLLAGSWDNSVRLWEVESSGKTVPKQMQTMGAPVLDVCWADNGATAYVAACDNKVQCWDLGSNKMVQVGQHDAPVKTCHWITGPNYTCLMTGSWDKTLKFWDTRSPTPIMSINLPERCYCADVDFPLAVVATADRRVNIYSLLNSPTLLTQTDSPLKFQHRAITIFRDRAKKPNGYALGSIEGRVAIQYVNAIQPKDNFTFKCHRLVSNDATPIHHTYPVNDIAFHPVYVQSLATVGADGTFSFWDKDERMKLKSSNTVRQSITKCCFNANGQIFAYAIGYDWSKGHEHYNPSEKPKIVLRACYDDLKPRSK